MGNTTSWGSDLYESTLGLVLPNLEPAPRIEDDDEVSVANYRVPAPRKPANAKYYMCKHMKRKKRCRYGTQCKFAHTRAELWIPASQFYQQRRVKLRPLPS